MKEVQEFWSAMLLAVQMIIGDMGTRAPNRQFFPQKF